MRGPLTLVLLGFVLFSCSAGSDVSVPTGWTTVDASVVSLALPPEFHVVAAGELADLGPVGDLLRSDTSVRFVARRSEGTTTPIDLIAVREYATSMLDVDVRATLERLSSTTVEANAVSLPIGPANRYAYSVLVSLPVVGHQATMSTVQWYTDSNTRVGLAVSRLGDGSQVPEADQVARTLDWSTG